MDTQKTDNDGITTLYKEAVENHRYVVEWRHKIMIRYFLTIAALFYVAKWMWETGSATIRNLLFLPFLFSAIGSIGYFLMEKRNTEIMHINARVSKRLELLLHESGGFYNDLLETKPTTMPVTTVFRMLYFLTTIISLIFSIISFLKYTL